MPKLTGLPNDIEKERWLLGNILTYRGFEKLPAGQFARELFYNSGHVALADAILRLEEENKPIELETVLPLVKDRDEFDMASLADLMGRGASSQNAQFYIQELQLLAIRRRAMKASEELARVAAGDQPIDEAITRHTEKLAGYLHELQQRDNEPIEWNEQLAQGLESLQDRIDNPWGVRTGFPTLDGHLSGLHPEHLTVLAARPATGKTAIGAQIWANACASGVPAMFCSVEMSRNELLHRTILGNAGFNTEDLNQGRVDAERVVNAARSMAKWDAANIKESIDLLSIRRDIRAFQRRLGDKPIGLIVVDYLQKIRTNQGFGTREREVSFISEALKEIAKQYKCPVLALAQLNRDADGQEPKVSDLRESGSIEQDADEIILMWKDKNHTWLKIGKNRHGSLAKIRLRYLEQHTAFEEEG